jgi:hypothetical protein
MVGLYITLALIALAVSTGSVWAWAAVFGWLALTVWAFAVVASPRFNRPRRRR